MWYYHSPIGVMKIFQSNSGRFILEILGERFFYHSPQAAADDVYCHTTGCYEWDSLDGSVLDVPSGIRDWDSY